MLPQSQQLQEATINYDTAEAHYRVTTRGANQSQLAAAQAQIAQAQSTLDRLKRGGLPLPRRRLPRPRWTSRNSRSSRRNAGSKTRAWSRRGTGSSPLNAVEGTLAGGWAVRRANADASRYHLDVQVDEHDMASLADGQPVTIELDALPDRKLTGSMVR